MNIQTTQSFVYGSPGFASICAMSKTIDFNSCINGVYIIRINLDSSNTSGDKSKIVSYSWIDDTGKEISNLPKLRVKLDRGKYRVELRIIDDDGNSTLDSIQVEVI